MERLFGSDAAFLYTETPSVHMHTLKVAVLDPTPALAGEAREVRMRRFEEELASRLEHLEGFRSRPLSVPLGLHHPVWAPDPAFDLRHHLRVTQLDRPGGRAELDRKVAEIASVPLDRSRPLWEIWMVDGLASGQVAFVAKIHHALADGVRAVALMSRVLSTSPEIEALRSQPWDPPPLPTSTELVLGALRDRPRHLAGMVPLVGRTLRRGMAVLRRLRAEGLPVVRPFRTPRAPFNGAIGPSRRFATTRLDLARVRKVAAGAGVKLGDVVLAMASGAVRAYLQRLGQLPAKSLVAAVPVGVAGALSRARNQVSNLLVPMATEEPNARQRLLRVAALADAAKTAHQDLGAEVLGAWAEYTPPRAWSWAYRLYSRWRVADVLFPGVNLIVSSVRGPDLPLYVAGLRLRELYSVGPIMEGLGLNFTAWSYAGSLGFSVLTDPRAVPDPAVLAALLEPALEALEAAS